MDWNLEKEHINEYLEEMAHSAKNSIEFFNATPHNVIQTLNLEQKNIVKEQFYATTDKWSAEFHMYGVRFLLTGDSWLGVIRIDVAYIN